MKKFLMVIAVAGFLVSCNNAADTEKRLKDSTDSATKAQKEMVEQSSDKSKDSLEQKRDATKDSIDRVMDKDSAR